MTEEYTSIAGSELLGQAGIYVLLSGLEPDISHILKIEYVYEDGRIEYTISEPTERVCFVAGTKVYTEIGLINIENIEEGMKVYSKNMTTGEKELKTVLSTSKNDTKVDTYKIYINEECIESTGTHPYYVKNKGFIEAKDLLIGDVLIDVNNEEKVIGNIEIVKNSQIIKVYNMNVAGNHNYYVGENMILVHNAGCMQ